MSYFNQENPRISIGMPVYNGEKYIQDALDTLIDQSYTHFELIISDNASSDNTEALCQKYAQHDVRIRYFRQTSNIGAAANFKFVLNQAEGAYFMWAACDDKWSVDWLKEMLNALITTHAEMAFGRVTHIDASGQPLHHSANNASFSYAASPLIRRVKFYLDYEGLGKANIICCLYAIRMRSELSHMLDECISGACRFDYTLIYHSLRYGRQVKANNAFIYKRVHNMSEGDKYSERPECEALYVKIGRKIWPFLPGLISDYLRHSSLIEKMILVLLIPIKLFNAYLFGIKKIFSTQTRTST